MNLICNTEEYKNQFEKEKLSKVEKNLKDNSTISNTNKFAILNKNFFLQPEEVVFRSLTEVLKGVGKKYYPVRGKKIDKLIYLTYLF